MIAQRLFVVFGLSAALTACFDNDHPPPGAGGLVEQTKVIDKAATVNQTIQAQDDKQRAAMDEQGR